MYRIRLKFLTIEIWQNATQSLGFQAYYAITSLNSSDESESTFWRAEPSLPFFCKGELNQGKLFALKTEPNRALGFPKLSNFLLFSVDFFKKYNFLVEKKNAFIYIFRIIP